MAKPNLHPSSLEYLLSFIPPFFHPSFLSSLLSCIPLFLYPSSPESLLSCLYQAMNPSFPSSLQSWIPAVPNPFFNLSLQSWILPFLHSSYPDLKVVWKASDRWLSSLMVWEGLKLEKRYTTRIKRYETLIKGSKFEEKVQNLIENMWNYEPKRFF